MANENSGMTAPQAPSEDATPNAIIERVKSYISTGSMNLPAEYSVDNAVRFAFLKLADMTSKDGKPIADVVTKASIATAVMTMAIQGLSLAKNQCYFIPYGNKLSYQRSAFGSVALAKRVADIKDIKGVAIFKDDQFEYEIEPSTGRKRVLKHVQTLECLDGEIKGAYAVVTFNDGTTDVELMTKAQLAASWSMSKAGTGTHTKFPEEMVIKTILGRAAKKHINVSNDSDLMGDDSDEIEEDKPTADLKNTLKTEANSKPLSFTPAEVTSTKLNVPKLEVKKKSEPVVSTPTPPPPVVKEEIEEAEVEEPVQDENEAGF